MVVLFFSAYFVLVFLVLRLLYLIAGVRVYWLVAGFDRFVLFAV